MPSRGATTTRSGLNVLCRKNFTGPSSGRAGSLAVTWIRTRNNSPALPGCGATVAVAVVPRTRPAPTETSLLRVVCHRHRLRRFPPLRLGDAAARPPRGSRGPFQALGVRRKRLFGGASTEGSFWSTDRILSRIWVRCHFDHNISRTRINRVASVPKMKPVAPK